jgi:serine/threonine-protein kinase
MEYVEGEKLSTFMRRERLTLEGALGIAAAIARALDHAHRRGVVHRDLKPENVLMTRDGQPKVVDFGMAKDLDSNTLRTVEGTLLGSPLYMSPEHVRGVPHAVHAAADVYAIGVILYQLVTGTPPFESARPLRDIFRAIAYDEPRRASEKCPGIPKALDDLLARALSKDPSRRHLTAAHLARELEALGRGETVPEETGAPIAASSIAELVSGGRLGLYRVLYAVGWGGVGVVFKARSEQGEDVALKLLADPQGRTLSRFAREERLMRELGAEAGFVPLLGSGTSELGPYLVMPFLEGGTLRDRLVSRGRLAVSEAVSIGLALARAMGRAHERGIVHRDLKPENVLFTAEDRPLITDLGIAKHWRRDGPGGSQSVSLSRAGDVRGTVGYMSPEQATESKEVGPPADVFALGAILHEALAGEPAFSAPNPIAVVAKVCRGARSGLRSVRTDVPAWLARVVDRALAPAPARRFESGSALARALESSGGV